MAGFKIALPIQTYQVKNKSVSDQKLLNMYVEKMPVDSKSQLSLYSTEGCKPLLDVSDDPIYGIYYMNPYLYVISGVNVYKVASDMSKTNIGNVGATNGVVRMADNGTQILVVKPNGDAYIITENSVSKIDDEDFPVVSDVAFNSQYFIVTEKDTGKFYWSALLDGTSWSALAYATQESNPDNVVGLMENKGDLWIFGDKTIEIWSPTGNPDLPFQRIGSGILNIGCESAKTISKDRNGIYWLGNDLQVHFANGYNEQRISTHDIERELAEDYDINDVLESYAFTYTHNGHDFYVLTIPNHKTWVFDMTTQVWHERKTTGLNTWLPSGCANAFNLNIVGGSDNGMLYSLDGNYFFDKENLYIEREVKFPPVFLQDNRMVFDKLYADIEVAPIKNSYGQARIMLNWSDDGGNLWSNEHWQSMGKIGEYRKRIIWRCLGQSRQRIYKMRITDPVQVSISGLYVEGDERYA